MGKTASEMIAAGNFPVASAKNVKGGRMEVADVTARNAIAAYLRTAGMVVRVTADADPDNCIDWEYLGADGTADNTKWFDARRKTVVNLLSGVPNRRPSSMPVIYIKGRSAANDGYGGTFVATAANISAQVAVDTVKGYYIPDPATPDGSAGGWVRDCFGDVLMARFFGAKGDGNAANAAANTTAVNCALAVAKSLVQGNDDGNGMSVWLDHGVYFTNGWDIKPNVTLEGPGSKHCAIKLATNANRSVIKVLEDTYAGGATAVEWDMSYATLKGFRVFGGSQTATSHGIEVVDSQYAVGTKYIRGVNISDVNVQYTRDHGIYIGNNRNYSTLKDVTCRYNGGHALHLAQLYDARFFNCDFAGNGATSVYSDADGVSFYGCNLFLGSTDHAVYLGNLAVNHTFVGCYLGECGKSAIYATGVAGPLISVIGGGLYWASKASSGTYPFIYAGGTSEVMLQAALVHTIPGGAVCSYLVELGGSAKAHLSGVDQVQTAVNLLTNDLSRFIINNDTGLDLKVETPAQFLAQLARGTQYMRIAAKEILLTAATVAAITQDIVFEGVEGATSLKWNFTGHTSPCLKLNCSNAPNVVMRGIKFDGDNKGTDIIEMNQGTLSVRGCKFFNSYRHPIYLHPLSSNNDFLVNNRIEAFFYNCGQHVVHAHLVGQSGSPPTIKGLDLTGSRIAGIGRVTTDANAVAITYDGTSVAHGALVSGIRFENTRAEADKGGSVGANGIGDMVRIRSVSSGTGTTDGIDWRGAGEWSSGSTVSGKYAVVADAGCPVKNVYGGYTGIGWATIPATPILNQTDTWWVNPDGLFLPKLVSKNGIALAADGGIIDGAANAACFAQQKTLTASTNTTFDIPVDAVGGFEFQMPVRVELSCQTYAENYAGSGAPFWVQWGIWYVWLSNDGTEKLAASLRDSVANDATNGFAPSAVTFSKPSSGVLRVTVPGGSGVSSGGRSNQIFCTASRGGVPVRHPVTVSAQTI